MLQVIGAFLLAIICAVDAVVLIGLAKIRPAAKVAAFLIASAWTSLIVAIAAAGGFANAATGPFPPPPLAFLTLMGAGLAAWFRWPAFRNALLSLPLAGLIGINAFRIGGVFFLMLHSRGELAAPFAISAGWGDIITGVAAIPLAIVAATNGRVPRGLVAIWTAFGTLDLIVAITLGALSAPGTPFQVFTEAPGPAAMGILPWVVVPTLLVPLYLMIHLTTVVRLREGGVVAGRIDSQAPVTRRAA